MFPAYVSFPYCLDLWYLFSIIVFARGYLKSFWMDTVYWILYNDPKQYSNETQIFCHCLIYFDKRWTQKTKNWTYSDVTMEKRWDTKSSVAVFWFRNGHFSHMFSSFSSPWQPVTELDVVFGPVRWMDSFGISTTATTQFRMYTNILTPKIWLVLFVAFVWTYFHCNIITMGIGLKWYSH